MRSLKIGVVIIALLLLIGQANALGISPGRVELNFEPNLEKTFTFYVLNRGDEEITVDFYVSGDLQEYVTLHQTRDILKAGETKAYFYDLKLPESLERPGKHDTRIGAVESVVMGMEEGTTVGARVGVESQLWIYVPYPGKYAEIRLEAPDAEAGESVQFTIFVSNLGELDVKAQDEVEIYSGEELATTLHAGEADIKSGERGTLTTIWNSENAKPGTYRAVARVRYNGNFAEAEDTFRLGEFLVKILGVEIGRIRRDGIAKFNVMVQSFWNQMISDAFINVEVFDGEKTIGSSNSETVDLEPWKNMTIPVYWDSRGVEPGEYNAKITAHYFFDEVEKTTETWVKIRIISLYGYLLIAGIVVCSAIAMFLLLKKRKGKKKR